MQPQIRQKPIRSFAIRAGRLTSGQQKAIDQGWQYIGLDLEAGQKGFLGAFANDAPRILEIGYGMGHSLLQMAEDTPQANFVGVEVHSPGVGSLISGAFDTQTNQPRLPNLKTYMADAVDVLREAVPADYLSRIQVYFPDPWHKKKHHKRRIIQPELVKFMSSRLAINGVLHLATDWAPYAEHMLEVLQDEPCLENAFQDYAQRPEWRPKTKFERRGEGLGHEVYDLVFVRKS